MDKFDHAIVAQLRENARASISAISEHVGLSRSAVAERIRKLESTNVIRGYQVMLSESQKDGVSAYLEIQHKRARCADVVPHFRAIPEVVSCYGVTGECDLIVLIKAQTMRRLHEIREHIDTIDDIVKIKTHVVLNQWMG
ncbi:Lrp/AsnC family transcriptional regulator [Aestuariibacter sp. A3R04]|uniref:Lrp/AsnC family transcriptional regulator n=1 Tax=Aestuariibacter sp. A3R04 TaxID=2841571 RepID=UPI001C083AFB|nr:Lrp/AsnC family transcriptional regulator [Aestuariibacter sp. A3R04]MBU3022379.1 Lrp/AsnC family transcriptional regulator [Aestuariibacter sp. A3R04]